MTHAGKLFSLHKNPYFTAVPNPPRNITWKLVPLSQQGAAVPPGHPPQPRQARDVPLLEEEYQGEVHADEEEYPSEEAPTEPPTQNATATAAADDYAYANATATANDGGGVADDDGVANGNETAEADEDAAFRTRPFTRPAPTGTPPPPADRAAEGEEFVNGLLPEYEDSNEPGSALGMPRPSAPPPPVAPPTRLPPPPLRPSEQPGDRHSAGP